MVYYLKHIIHFNLYSSIMRKFIIIAVSLLFATNLVLAHGTGQSFEKPVGDYLVDIGIDAVTSYAGEQIRLDFNLWNKEKTESIDFSDVWVRIAPKDGFGIVFAGYLDRPEFGLTGMTFTFPKGGDYQLTVRFNKDGEKIAEDVSFDTTVDDDPNAAGNGNLFAGLIIGVVVTGTISFFLKRKKQPYQI